MELEHLRALCAALPGTTEDVKWGDDLCFCVGAKMYAVTGLTDASGITLKVEPDEFPAYTARDGIEPAKYVGRFHWISVDLTGGCVDDAELAALIRHSYTLIRKKLPKRVRDELAPLE